MIGAVEILKRTPRTSKLIEQGNLETLQEEIEKSVTYHKMQSMNQSLAALVLHGVIDRDRALRTSNNAGDLDLILRRFLFAEEADHGPEDDDMAESLSDFSKILELQEIKKAYEDVQERHSIDLADRETEIQRLKEQLSEQIEQQSAGGSIEGMTTENERLTKQIGRLKQEYESKIERLNSRIKELSAASPQGAGATPVSADPSRKGFFRR
jgi:hypothetical protein